MIIFDLDDTLIDTSGSITPIKIERAIKALCAQGLFVEKYEEALKIFLEINKLSESSRQSLKTFLEKLKADKSLISVGLKEIYKGSLEGIEIKPLKEAPEVLKRLSKSHMLAIVTVGEYQQQMEKLEKGGIDLNLFKKILVLEEKNKATAHKVEVNALEARPKSRQVYEEFIAKALWTTNKIGEFAGRSPRESPQLYEQLQNKGPFYHKIAQELHFDPHAVVVCGDRIALDLIPARELGFNTVQMKWGRGLNSIDTYGAVDYTVDSFRAFEKLIGKMEKNK